MVVLLGPLHLEDNGHLYMWFAVGSVGFEMAQAASRHQQTQFKTNPIQLGWMGQDTPAPTNPPTPTTHILTSG